MKDSRGGRSKGLTIVDSRKKDLTKEALCLGIGVENRSRILVFIFINWTPYKKNNLFWFSCQVGEVLVLDDSLYFVSLVSLLIMN